MKKLILILAVLTAACEKNYYNTELPIAKECKDVLLKWETPMSRMDGTNFHLFEVDHFRIQARLNDETESYLTQDVMRDEADNVVEMLSFAMTYLKTGKNCFKINVTDIDQQTSPWSEEACIDLEKCIYEDK
jgi:hypothetical protein